MFAAETDETNPPTASAGVPRANQQNWPVAAWLRNTLSDAGQMQMSACSIVHRQMLRAQAEILREMMSVVERRLNESEAAATPASQPVEKVKIS